MTVRGAWMQLQRRRISNGNRREETPRERRASFFKTLLLIFYTCRDNHISQNAISRYSHARCSRTRHISQCFLILSSFVLHVDTYTPTYTHTHTHTHMHIHTYMTSLNVTTIQRWRLKNTSRERKSRALGLSLDAWPRAISNRYLTFNECMRSSTRVRFHVCSRGYTR